VNDPLRLNDTPLPVKFRVEDYLLLDASGAFDHYAKTELIEGEIVYMNAQHRPHAYAKTQLLLAVTEVLKRSGSRYAALVEGSIEMPDDSVPEPDIVLTSEPFGEGLIPLASVGLIIEVADSTLANDLGRKARLYAMKGVPEYWVVDVKGERVHQLWSPRDADYIQRREVRFGDHLTAVTIPDLTIALLLSPPA